MVHIFFDILFFLNSFTQYVIGEEYWASNLSNNGNITLGAGNEQEKIIREHMFDHLVGHALSFQTMH